MPFPTTIVSASTPFKSTASTFLSKCCVIRVSSTLSSFATTSRKWLSIFFLFPVNTASIWKFSNFIRLISCISYSIFWSQCQLRVNFGVWSGCVRLYILSLSWHLLLLVNLGCLCIYWLIIQMSISLLITIILMSWLSFLVLVILSLPTRSSSITILYRVPFYRA